MLTKSRKKIKTGIYFYLKEEKGERNIYKLRNLEIHLQKAVS